MSAFRFIAAQKANHPISVMCRMLDVARSGFHAWERRAPSDRQLSDAWLLEKIKQIHAEKRRGMARRASTPSPRPNGQESQEYQVVHARSLRSIFV